MKTLQSLKGLSLGFHLLFSPEHLARRFNRFISGAINFQILGPKEDSESDPV